MVCDLSFQSILKTFAQSRILYKLSLNLYSFFSKRGEWLYSGLRNEKAPGNLFQNLKGDKVLDFGWYLLDLISELEKQHMQDHQSTLWDHSLSFLWNREIFAVSHHQRSKACATKTKCLPATRVPLVKLPGIKLYPLTWLDYLC